MFRYSSGIIGKSGKCEIPKLFPSAVTINGFDSINNDLNKTLEYLHNTGIALVFKLSYLYLLKTVNKQKSVGTCVLYFRPTNRPNIK